MERKIFEEEHIMFRDAFTKFLEKEALPHQEEWEKNGIVSREAWKKAGEAGFLAMEAPEEYGGTGVKDFRFNLIINEVIARGGGGRGFALTLHNDVIAPYYMSLANEEQKKRWLPGIISGDLITAIAMTEPDTGSDLAGVKTTAVDKGDHYLVNGSKTFISNGILNDIVIVVAKTDPSAGHKGISLLVVERGMEGYERGRNLDKIGQKAQDTSELFFSDVKVPKENLMGEAGMGFKYLMRNLPQERLSIAIGAVASAEAMLEITAQYCTDRKAFGQPIGMFQNSRFKLAEMKTEIEIGRVFVDRCVMELLEGTLTAEEAAMAKWWTTEMQKKVIDQCLQLHGGNGYMTEFPIARAYMDARVMTIFGGTTEIMKEIIGRSMGF